MKKVFVYASVLLIVSCAGNDQKTNIDGNGLPALVKADNPESFNQLFGKLLADYYHLKDNFITESDTLIDHYAQNLMTDTDSLKFSELKADSSIVLTAKSSAESISGELKGLLGEKDIEAKRKSFYMLSEQMYDLIRTVQYNKEVIYHIHCPMAFDGAGANWLSNSSQIRNPYIPKKMITCGEITDTLDFSIKN